MSSTIKNTLVYDILAGLTVSFAALSLGAAFGTMSGRGAFAGMIGAAIIPIITSIFGGTRLQASGPTAPMTALSALVIANAYESFADKVLAEQYITLVFLMSAVFVFIAGILRTGRFIQWVPQVVILGFMNGIGVLIWADQIKRLFGLAGKEALAGSTALNVGITLSTLTLIYLIPMFLRAIGVPAHIRKFLPGMFITILLVTFITSITQLNIQHVDLGATVDSLGAFLVLIKSYFPQDASLFSSAVLLQALPFALQLTLLAYLDSLLTSLVIDKMTGEKSNQDKELLAQGMANGASAILQGIPGAQATIRSVLLLKEGAKTRFAGVMVGVFALLGFLVFAKYISMITSAVFVGVLLKAGLDVLDRDFIGYYYKLGWAKDKLRNIQLLFIIYTTLVTVFWDLNVAVFTGTAFFYLGKRLMSITDAEENFAEVTVRKEETLLGQEVETY
jgi:sulfate permease, SulP family